MANNNQHSNVFSCNMYECVDSELEYIQGAAADTNGGVLHFVTTDCEGDGTINHCPPYEKDKQLTCVVCTKQSVCI